LRVHVNNDARTQPFPALDFPATHLPTLKRVRIVPPAGKVPICFAFRRGAR
jgi:hypothetical protein